LRGGGGSRIDCQIGFSAGVGRERGLGHFTGIGLCRKRKRRGRLVALAIEMERS
jgi:hypothetical protein